MAHADPDEELLRRVAKGEPEAVRAMVQSKLPRLINLARRMLNDPAEAEDVAQETLLRLWRQAPGWRSGKARLDTWLYRVALNLCYDRLRRRRDVVGEPPDRADPAPLADSEMIAAQRAAQVEAALGALPVRQREAIVLQYFEGLSNIEAAGVMRIGVEALESLLARARRTLRTQLTEGAGA